MKGAACSTMRSCPSRRIPPDSRSPSITPTWGRARPLEWRSSCSGILKARGPGRQSRRAGILCHLAQRRIRNQRLFRLHRWEIVDHRWVGVSQDVYCDRPVNPDSGNPINVALTYNAANHTLTENMEDTVTHATYTTAENDIDVAATLGSRSPTSDSPEAREPPAARSSWSATSPTRWPLRRRTPTMSCSTRNDLGHRRRRHGRGPDNHVWLAHRQRRRSLDSETSRPRPLRRISRSD